MILSSCAFQQTALQRIEHFSGLDLPDDMTEIFNSTHETFTGVAGQYAVFSLKEETDIFVGPKQGEPDLDENKKNEILYYLENFFEEVPTEYYPDFSKEFKCAIGAESTYVLYFPSDLEIKVLMMGH
jgi:hypothetical protein